MAKFKGPNAKQEAGRDKKAANAAVKQAASDKAREATEAQEWKKGSNVRGAVKSAAVAQKADEAARKRAEKAALLAAEEEESGNIKPKKNPTNGKSKKKKAKNELSLLEEALVGDAEKKSKAAKRADRLKKEREDRLRQEREKKRAQEANNLDPLLANTDAMIGSAYATDNGETSGGGALNAPLSANEAAGTGIDSALSALSVGKADDQHPEKRMRALHLAFEEKLMPEMKRDYPGLKRSQYKEKIFAVWKKSPENPMNWPQQS